MAVVENQNQVVIFESLDTILTLACGTPYGIQRFKGDDLILIFNNSHMG
jgi:hypothetical protein